MNHCIHSKTELYAICCPGKNIIKYLYHFSKNNLGNFVSLWIKETFSFTDILNVPEDPNKIVISVKARNGLSDVIP